MTYARQVKYNALLISHAITEFSDNKSKRSYCNLVCLGRLSTPDHYECVSYCFRTNVTKVLSTFVELGISARPEDYLAFIQPTTWRPQSPLRRVYVCLSKVDIGTFERCQFGSALFEVAFKCFVDWDMASTPMRWTAAHEKSFNHHTNFHVRVNVNRDRQVSCRTPQQMGMGEIISRVNGLVVLP